MCGYMCAFHLCPQRGPRSNDTPVVISTCGTHVLVSKYHSILKMTRAFGEMIGSKSGAGKISVSLESPQRIIELNQKDKEISLRNSHWPNMRQSEHQHK